MLSRKATFKMYPNATERQALERCVVAHCKVFNTLLEVSKLRYKAGLSAYNRASVCQDAQAVRNQLGWVKERTLANSLQVTGERLVKAFDAFFRRLAAGETPGYPRFKSARRYSGFGFKKQGEGYRLQRKVVATEGGPAFRYGSVVLSGIGTIGLRGKARFDGRPTSAEVSRKGDDWYLSVTFEVTEEAVARPCLGLAPFVFDAGITDLLTTLKYDQGAAVFDTVANPRWLKARLAELVRLQREVSALEEVAKKSSGRLSGFAVNAQLGAAYTRLRRVHRKVRNQRTDFYEKLTTWMAQTFGHIITEELDVSSMLTQEGKGSGLKRGIADAAWATGLLDKISRKAEEAGGKFEMVPTRLVKPTRRCSCCGLVKAKEDMPMSQRVFVCLGCGFTLQRDQNACKNMARYAFEGAWWPKEIGAGTSPETPSQTPVWVE